MKRYIILLTLVGLLNIYAQTEKATQLSGNLMFDSRLAFEHYKNSPDDSLSNIKIEGLKSPFLAGGLSAIVPGAGEVYTGHYVKAAIFGVIEAAVITVAVIYDNKGDDETNLFQNFADKNWDVNQYARWTLNHATEINSDVDPAQYNVFDNGKLNWDELNRLESDIGHFYSHRLPHHGDQQYYEEIGKYPQYATGWDDFGTNYTDPADAPYQYGDPLTDHFHYYSGLRGQANDFYNVASKAVVVLIINHVISAIDAAWSASRYNKALEMNVDLKKQNIGFRSDYYPQLNVKVRL